MKKILLLYSGSRLGFRIRVGFTGLGLGLGLEIKAPSHKERTSGTPLGLGLGLGLENPLTPANAPVSHRRQPTYTSPAETSIVIYGSLQTSGRP